MMQAIATYARNNPGHSVLVVADTNLKKCYRALDQILAGASIRVEGYKRNASRDKKKSYLHGKAELHTSDPGTVTCVHWRSMKGLEADAVFVPEIENHNMGNDGTFKEQMRLYVMFSRARQFLEMQCSSSTPSHDRMLTLMRKKAGNLVEWRSE